MRRARATAALAVVAGLAALAWWVWRDASGGRQAVVLAAPFAAVTGAPAPEPTHAPILPAAASAVEADRTCGLGAHLKYTGSEPTEAELKLATRAASQALVAATLQAMLASPDPEARAAGLAMRASGTFSDAVQLDACDGDDCSAALAGLQQRLTDHKLQAGDDLQALAALARSSRQPVLYQLALQTCAQGVAPATAGACAGLSLERLAELDPDNASPWLALAGEAQRRGDLSGVANAMHRAALATRMGGQDGLLVRQALAHAPVALARGLPRLDLLGRALGLEMTLVPLSQSSAAVYCQPAQLAADSNRQAPCERIAHLMLSRGSTLLDVAVGLELGKRLGLPAAELVGAEREMALSREAGSRFTIPDEKMPTQQARCELAEQMNHHFEQVALHGERAVYRALMHP